MGKMANKNGSGSKSESAPATKPQPPAGYLKPTGSVDQFWHEEGGPIHGVLVGGKSYVNKASRRTNVIYIFRLVDECKVETNKGEVFELPAKVGEIVGVWGSPGMRDLNDLQGCKVWMARDGSKDVGQPMPMKTYNIVFQGQGKPLVVTGLRGEQPQGNRAAEAGTESDNIPF